LPLHSATHRDTDRAFPSLARGAGTARSRPLRHGPRCAAGVAAHHRPGPSPGDRTRCLDARRDDRRPPRQPHRTGAGGPQPDAGRRQERDLHLPPHDRDRLGVRPGHGPARGRDGGNRRCRRGVRRAHRGTDAGRGGRSAGGARRAARRRTGTTEAHASGLGPQPVPQHPPQRRLLRPLRGRGPRRRRPGRTGPGRVVRRVVRLGTTRGRRDLRQRQPRFVPPPGRRHPRRPGLRARRPRRGAPDATLGAREHRPPLLEPCPAMGLDPQAEGTRHGVEVHREAPDRHARPRRGTPPVRRQSAEGDDRPLGRLRGRDPALFRPDPRNRHPHEEPDLCAATRVGRLRSRHPLVHVGTQRDPARLRSRHRHLRRRGRRRSGRPKRRRADSPQGRPQHRLRHRDRRGGGRDLDGGARSGLPRARGDGAVSAAVTTRPEAASGWATALGSALRRSGWTLSLLGILAVLLVITKTIQPTFGAAGIQGLAISVMPLALASVAQAVVVIARGIDLSVGSMMALTSVVSAALMEARSEGFAVWVVIGTLVLGLALGAVNGALVVGTRVPDIVVTLAMLFVWAGCALLVMETPGGASAQWLRGLTSGPLVSTWVPKAAVVMLLIVAVVWIPIRRSRLGLSLYAIGSDPLAAFRSGVSVGRTKIFAYMLTGLISAVAGLSLTATTGLATPGPGPYTLMSVAAVVLGGVALSGGKGGVFGPIVAVVILSLLRTMMTFLNVNTNLATVVQGAILVGVVMVGSLIQLRRSRR